MVNVAFIVNGSCKLSLLAKETITDACQSELLNTIIETTKNAGHASELAIKLAQSHQVIIAVGGDGTCNEVVNGILSSGHEEVVFGIIPNGTGNDFHRMLGTFDRKLFVVALEQFASEKIDLCHIQMDSVSRYALNIAGAGFDGHVVQTLQRQRSKGLGGKISYAIAIVRSFFVYKKPTVTIESDEFNYSGKMLMVAICNGSTFGHGIVINPMAKINDGLLNVTFLADVSLMDYVKNLSKLKRGEKISHSKIHYFETTQLSVQINANTMYVETDGEVVSEGDVQFKIVPNALSILSTNYI
jgi:diacylglycerol kinase (ATP)